MGQVTAIGFIEDPGETGRLLDVSSSVHGLCFSFFSLFPVRTCGYSMGFITF